MLSNSKRTLPKWILSLSFSVDLLPPECIKSLSIYPSSDDDSRSFSINHKISTYLRPLSHRFIARASVAENELNSAENIILMELSRLAVMNTNFPPRKTFFPPLTAIFFVYRFYRFRKNLTSWPFSAWRGNHAQFDSFSRCSAPLLMNFEEGNPLSICCLPVSPN